MAEVCWIPFIALNCSKCRGWKELSLTNNKHLEPMEHIDTPGCYSMYGASSVQAHRYDRLLSVLEPLFYMAILRLTGQGSTGKGNSGRPETCENIGGTE